MRLQGKIAIVTGGGIGIGKAYSFGLAAEGAKVVVADIAFEVAQAVAGEIERQGGTALAIKVDVVDEASVNDMAQQTIERFGRIDILVNNAALFSPLERRRFEEVPVEEWDRVMAVNARGVFLCARAVFPHMKAQGKGKIINISSSTVLHGAQRLSHYVASKGAVLGLTRALACELGDFGINVNAIMPGLTDSENVIATVAPEYLDRFVSGRCIKRREVPNDLVGTVIFLASDDSDFITGQTINVDGGYVFH